MTCEEFELAGLDLESLQEDDPAHQAAREHLRLCPRCAALHESWQTLRADLHAVGAETQEAEAPARVEMRLRQEFRTRHKTVKARRAAVFAGWTLAAAAVVVAAVSWVNWRHENGKGSTPSAVNSGQGVNMNQTTPAGTGAWRNNCRFERCRRVHAVAGKFAGDAGGRHGGARTDAARGPGRAGADGKRGTRGGLDPSGLAGG